MQIPNTCSEQIRYGFYYYKALPYPYIMNLKFYHLDNEEYDTFFTLFIPIKKWCRSKGLTFVLFFTTA